MAVKESRTTERVRFGIGVATAAVASVNGFYAATNGGRAVSVALASATAVLSGNEITSAFYLRRARRNRELIGEKLENIAGSIDAVSTASDNVLKEIARTRILGRARRYSPHRRN